MLRQYRMPTILHTPTICAKIVGMSNATGHTVKCGRCHRILRSERSIRDGYGRGCKARMRAAAIAAAVKGFAQRQIEAAMEIIEDKALVATNRPGVYRAASSDGTQTYLTHSQTCGCASGLRRLTATTCKHSLAVVITLAIKAP
jgi:hypothetical protein